MIYAFKDLKGKLKVGMKVKRVGPNSICDELSRGGVCIITNVDDQNGSFWVNHCEHLMFGDSNSTSLEILDESPEEITWETLKVGDKVTQYVGAKECKVLAILGDIVALSYENNQDMVNGWFTKEWLKTYQIVQPISAVTPMTLQQIEKALGKKIKIVEDESV